MTKDFFQKDEAENENIFSLFQFVYRKRNRIAFLKIMRLLNINLFLAA